MVLVIAHRTSCGLAPENSESGIKISKKLNVDMIEIDVRLTKDLVPILFHDPRVRRFIPSREKIKDLNYKDLKKMDIGSKVSELFAGENPITLDDAFRFNKAIPFVIHIKITDLRVVKICLDIIKKHKAQDRVYILTHSKKIVREIRKKNKKIEILFLFYFNNPFFLFSRTHMWLSFFKKYGIHRISLNSTGIKEGIIRKCKEHGLWTNIWTINRETLMIKLIKKEVDSITTNFPNRLLGVIQHEMHKDFE